MVSDATYMARIARILYEQHAYEPNWMAVADVQMAILPSNYIGSGQDADSAIERCALDPVSPVIYTDGTGQSALSLEGGDRGQVNARVKDWIERHDRSELPFGLR